MKKNPIQTKSIEKQKLELFVKYMKEKCGLDTSKIKYSKGLEGHREMYQIVFPDQMSEVCTRAWNYFMNTTERKIRENFSLEEKEIITKKNEYGLLYWDTPLNIDMYFIYKIHLKVIADFLHSEESEKIFKFCDAEEKGCY